MWCGRAIPARRSRGRQMASTITTRRSPWSTPTRTPGRRYAAPAQPALDLCRARQRSGGCRMNTDFVQAVVPALVAAFAIQQFLEVLDAALAYLFGTSYEQNKGTWLGLA